MGHESLLSATYPNYSLSISDSIQLLTYGILSLIMGLLSKIAMLATITEDQDPILMIFNIYHVRPIWLSIDSIIECVSNLIKLFMAFYTWQ